MLPTPILRRILAITAAAAASLLLPVSAPAHCDGVDGPVVTEAVAAIASGDVTPVLKWVPERDEAHIRTLFEKTLSVRTLNDDARELADRHFAETLVRLHRAHEGAPFTGIKPTGTPVNPAVSRADAALAEGNADALADHIADAVRDSIRQRFADAHAAQAHKDHDVEHGRAYVQAYVDFVHHVKGLHEALTASHHHGDDAGDAHAGH